MGTVISIFKQCRVPLCENDQAKEHNWPMCEPCMVNSVKRFIQCDTREGSKEDKALYWIKHICENIEELVGKEQKVIDEHGAEYDRDKLL